MAIDTATSDCDSLVTTDSPIDGLPKSRLILEAMQRAGDTNAEAVFGNAVRRGSLYRWGRAAAQGYRGDELEQCLSRWASDRRVGGKRSAALDLESASHEFIEQAHRHSALTPLQASRAVQWAAALPNLVDRIERRSWMQILRTLHQLHESVLQRDQPWDASHLMIGGELALTLSWRLGKLDVAKRWKNSGALAVKQWGKQQEEALSNAIAGGIEARLVLASLLRSMALLEKTARQKPIKKLETMGDWLATWIAAMTTPEGTAFSSATRTDLNDDLGKDGLLNQAKRFDPETLTPATDAALGRTHSGGRLAWEVCLPEAIHHDSQAQLAVMFNEWDVRRGRIHLDYSQEWPRLEIFGGKKPLIAGRWQTMIETDGVEQEPAGPWSEVCEYSDDEIHYLEIEQSWSGGMVLQRQLMQIRDDRCLLWADAVLPASDNETPPLEIRYASRLPLAEDLEAEAEEETRELWLGDGKRRVMAVPLSASEWRVGPSAADLRVTADHHLLSTAEGNNRLYAAVWFDLQKRRFRRKRTWRQLTVGDQLRIVENDEAVSYRIQVGSEQWMLYRSLAEPRCRTVLGKHLIADFFCSRFDPGDGSHEELITVDDSQTEDD